MQNTYNTLRCLSPAKSDFVILVRLFEFKSLVMKRKRIHINNLKNIHFISAFLKINNKTETLIKRSLIIEYLLICVSDGLSNCVARHYIIILKSSPCLDMKDQNRQEVLVPFVTNLGVHMNHSKCNLKTYSCIM